MAGEERTGRDRLKRECEVTTFRSRGPGGQHRNVTESAVRIVHIPTGILVVGQSHRSQHRNLQDALERLEEKLKVRSRKRVPRIRTGKPRSLRKKELGEKRRRAEIKKLRRPPGEE